MPLPSDCVGKDNSGDGDGVRTEPLTMDAIYGEVRDLARIFEVEERGEKLVTELRGGPVSGPAPPGSRPHRAEPGQTGFAVVPRRTRRGVSTTSRGSVRSSSRRSTAAVTACRACSSAPWLTVVRLKQLSRECVSSS